MRRPPVGRTGSGPDRRPIPPPPEPEVRAEPVRREPVEYERVSEQRSSGSAGGRRAQDVEVDPSVADFAHHVPASTAAKLERRLSEAAEAYMVDRFADARRLLRSIDQLAPGIAEVQELLGLCEYRTGRWREATQYLERFVALSGGDTVEQHPVLADCARALGQHQRVDELWHELAEASPSAELLEEGRIVLAGSLTDRGRPGDAIRVLERAPAPRGRPQVHHLRRSYVLADLYERAGDVTRARRLFEEILKAEPDFADAAQRRAALT